MLMGSAFLTGRDSAYEIFATFLIDRLDQIMSDVVLYADGISVSDGSGGHHLRIIRYPFDSLQQKPNNKLLNQR